MDEYCDTSSSSVVIVVWSFVYLVSACIVFMHLFFCFFFLFVLCFFFFFCIFFFFQAEDGIRDRLVTGVQTCALPISFYVYGYTYCSIAFHFVS